MRLLENQTLYQCEFCNKRLLTKKGAELHENDYCWHANSPHQKAIKEKKLKCEHKNTEMQYSYIPGEAVMQPDHELCIDCNTII